MLSKADNELLTRSGPGTPMGGLLRRYWQPAALSAELAAAGPAREVLLMGEDLVAFRNLDGSVGLLGRHCSHRAADLGADPPMLGGRTVDYQDLATIDTVSAADAWQTGWRERHAARVTQSAWAARVAV